MQISKRFVWSCFMSKYFVVNNYALLYQHQNIWNDMNIMAQWCSSDNRIIHYIKSVLAASLEEFLDTKFRAK